MKLSISNIAWNPEYDKQMYEYLQSQKFSGLEIAPTRIFHNNPYERLNEAKVFSDNLKAKYDLVISSMQSIWFGKNENIFSSRIEREILFNYTKKVIDFAKAIDCKNIVFGCPKNRNITKITQYDIAVKFFHGLGEYAKKNNTYLAIEPNPVIYNTNFINTTNEAFKLALDVNSTGIKVNIDFGTIIQNNENLNILEKNINLINHIHISEPFLEKIKVRKEHKYLSEILKSLNYGRFVSIELKNLNNINLITDTVEYIKEVFI